jgi:hypothetical protein
MAHPTTTRGFASRVALVVGVMANASLATEPTEPTEPTPHVPASTPTAGATAPPAATPAGAAPAAAKAPATAALPRDLSLPAPTPASPEIPRAVAPTAVDRAPLLPALGSIQSDDAGAPLVVPVSLGILGFAAVTVGTVSGIFALENKGYAEDHCSSTQQLCDEIGIAANREGRLLAAVSGVTLAFGGLAVVGAFAIYRSSDDRTAFSAGATPSGGQLRLSHRW